MKHVNIHVLRKTNRPVDLRYNLRNNTERLQREREAQEAEDTQVWRIHLERSGRVWEFPGYLGKNRAAIEALEGEWVAGDGKIVGMNFDWTLAADIGHIPDVEEAIRVHAEKSTQPASHVPIQTQISDATAGARGASERANP